MSERHGEGSSGRKRHRVLLQEGMSAPIEKKGMSAKGDQPAKPMPPPQPSDSAGSAKPKK